MSDEPSARLLLDQMLPPKATRDLKGVFAEIRHVREFGLEAAVDPLVHALARKSNFMIVTKDADYLDLLLSRGHPPKIIYLQFGNCPNAVLVATLGAYRDAIETLWSNDEGMLEITFPVKPDPVQPNPSTSSMS